MQLVRRKTILTNLSIVLFFLTIISSVLAAPCTEINSTIINSVTSSVNKECIITNSTIIDSYVEDSTISYSNINSSTIIDSTIINTSFISSNHTHSSVSFSQLCTDSKGYYTSISNNILYYGAFSYNGYTYFLPKNISKICQGQTPSAGVLSANKTIVKSGESIKLVYTGTVGASIIASDLYSNRNSNPQGQIYSRIIKLDVPTQTDNYTVAVEINTSNFNYSHAKADGGDIRFYDADNELRYYIENWNVSGRSIIWVKIKNSGDSSFMMAYGNSSLSSQSNASAAFLFYDDFESYSIGSTGEPTWNVTSGLWSVQDDSGNKVYRTTTTQAWIDAYTNLVGINESNFSVSARIKATTINPYMLALNVRGLQTLAYCVWSSNNGISWGQQSWLTNDYFNLTWHTLKGDSYMNITEIYLDDAWKANKTSSDVLVNFGLYYNYAAGYFDDIKIRKFVRPDPKISVGLETPQIILSDSNNNGIYEGIINITDTQAQGIMLFKAIINDNLGNILYQYINLTLDNAQPYSSINISEGNTTYSSIVVLTLNYSDANGVDSCAYKNDDGDFTNIPFEPCTPTKQWMLSSGYGDKTVFYAIKDFAGNINTVNSTISYLQPAWDNTPPTINYAYDGLGTEDMDYFNSNTTLSAHWNAIDYESRYVSYKYRILADGIQFYPAWPIAYYALDDNLNDSSGNNYEATCSGATCPAYDPSGKYGGGYHFDGTDDVITAPDSRLGLNSTISWWAKIDIGTTKPDSQNPIFHKAYYVPDWWNYRWFELQPNVDNSGIFHAWAYSCNGDCDANRNDLEIPSNRNIIDSQWHNYVLVFQEPNNGSLYIDGEFMGSDTFAYADWAGATSSDTYFGRSCGYLVTGCASWLRYFDGYLDDFAVFNKSFSASEVLSNYQNGLRSYADAGSKTQAVVSNLTLLPGVNYSFEVNASNPWNISSTMTSDGAVLDLENPNITLLTSITHPDENLSYAETTASFEWAAQDNALIEGYSYVLDSNPATTPDNMIESKGNESMREINPAEETGIVGLWHLNNNSSYGDDGTNAYDYSGHNNNGTIIGSPTWDPDGKFKGTYDFDGIDDCISIPHDPMLAFGETKAYSLELWMKMQEYPSDATDATLIGKWNDPFHFDYEIGLWMWDNHFYQQIYLNSNPTVINYNLSLAEWHHLVVTDTGNNEFKLYIDGQNRMLDSSGNIRRDVDANPLWIGCWNNQRHFKGKIDEVAVYNQTLSAGQVLNHYLDGIPGSNNASYSNLASGTYYFHLKAIDAAGNSAVAHRKIVVLSNTSKINLIQGKTETEQETINITGNTSINADVLFYVNGLNTLNMTAEGLFNAEIALNNGTNYIYAVASANNLTTTSNTIKITRLNPQYANLSITLSFNSAGTGTSRIAYYDSGSYIFGLAAESPNSNPASNPLAVSTNSTYSAFIFLSTQNADLRSKNSELEKKAFLDSQSPMFRPKSNDDFVGLILRPDTWLFIQNSSAGQGRYELVLENMGKENGKARVKALIR